MPQLIRCDRGHDAVSVSGAIIGGKFGQYCRPCIQTDNRGAGAHYAAIYREQDRREYARDMLQPWDGNGDINPEFVREYPEESAEMFTEDEINQALRKAI